MTDSAHRDVEALVERVKAGAHFYMAHRMREFPHPSAPEITVAEHVPAQRGCPGCDAEAALNALLARLEQVEKERDSARRELFGTGRALANADARVQELEAALREIGDSWADDPNTHVGITQYEWAREVARRALSPDTAEER